MATRAQKIETSAVRGVLGLTATLMAFGILYSSSGAAQPADDRVLDQYPSMDHIVRTYAPHEPSEYFIPNVAGVWFLTPSGINCGIWDKGSFGCAGEIPGLPQGSRHIGWWDGERWVHFDWWAMVKFPPGQAQRPLPPRSFVEYNGTMCAVTADSSTYCTRGPYRFLITAQGTLFNPYR
jgi:hypothetical protein